jgi:hypothetical protein
MLASRPAALPLPKEPPLSAGHEVDPPESVRTWWTTEHLCPFRESKLDFPVVQPVASHYSDRAIRALKYNGRHN